MLVMHNPNHDFSEYYDALYERNEDTTEVCDHCDEPTEECTCHEHDKYDERRDADHE